MILLSVSTIITFRKENHYTMIKKLFLDLLFPKFCFLCGRESSYLCEDCQSIIEVLQSHQNSSGKYLQDLYWATPYEGNLIKKLIYNFKYEPFIKELSQSFSLLIINHFQLIEKHPDFSDFLLIPVPLHKKKLRWRGFNQAEEITKELSGLLEIPWIRDCLVKIKETPPQIELSEKAREKNILRAFLVKDKGLIQGRKILLVDDIYTTGSTMEECARVLKEAGVKEIIGVVIARG